MIVTEFFATLAEAKAFRPARCAAWDIYGLDKPGTAKRFREWRDAAMAFERREAAKARAVVVIYK